MTRPVLADLGLRYYPKLLGMSPVSPVLGYHHVQAEDEALLTRSYFGRLIASVNRTAPLAVSHVDPQWRPRKRPVARLAEPAELGAAATTRLEDYLKGFNANQRRNIKRERKAVAKAGITVTPPARPAGLRSADHAPLMSSTVSRLGRKYLEEGFSRRWRGHRDQLVLFSAHADPRDPVGMSMCVQDAGSCGPLLGQQ